MSQELLAGIPMQIESTYYVVSDNSLVPVNTLEDSAGVMVRLHLTYNSQAKTFCVAFPNDRITTNLEDLAVSKLTAQLSSWLDSLGYEDSEFEISNKNDVLYLRQVK